MIPNTSLYNFDFVFCIDNSSITKDYAEIVKTLPFELDRELNETCSSLYKAIKQVRVGFVAYNRCEGGNVITSSPFFTYPTDKEKIDEFLERIDFSGEEGDYDVALNQAIKFPWIQVPKGEKRKHAIILLSGGDLAKKDLTQLKDIWTDSGDDKPSKMSFKHKYLFLATGDNQDLESFMGAEKLAKTNSYDMARTISEKFIG